MCYDKEMDPIFAGLPDAEQLRQMSPQQVTEAVGRWEQELEATREQRELQMKFEAEQVDLWGSYARNLQWALFLISLSCIAVGLFLSASDDHHVVGAILLIITMGVMLPLLASHRLLWRLAGRLSGTHVRRVAARAGLEYQPRSG